MWALSLLEEHAYNAYHDLLTMALSSPGHNQSRKFWIRNWQKQALIKRIDDYERICNVITPLYWIASFASEHKYLIFDNSLAINKNLLEKYTEFWDVIKHKIKRINICKETDYIKIKFESDDDLPLN